MWQAKRHAKEKQGLTSIPPHPVVKVKAAIREHRLP